MRTFIQAPLKRTLAIAGLALAVPLSALAFQGAKGGGHDRCDGMGPHAAGMQHGGPMGALRGLHRLDLSEAQEDQIFDLMHAQAPVMRDQMRALRKSEQELKTLKTAADYSDAKARVLVDRIAKQRADMEMARLQNERKVLDVLTPEQRKALAEMKPQRRNDRSPKGEQGGPKA